MLTLGRVEPGEGPLWWNLPELVELRASQACHENAPPQETFASRKVMRAFLRGFVYRMGGEKIFGFAVQTRYNAGFVRSDT
jgi:hypothetical protein